MLQVVTSDLAVSSEDFLAFVARHEVMCVEDNDDMSESYIMVDPLGRFFQNTAGQKGFLSRFSVIADTDIFPVAAV